MIKYIKEKAKEENIEFVGICNFKLISSSLIQCKNIKKIPNNPSSIIVFLFPYYIDIKIKNISRYAIIKDYHIVCYQKLLKISDELNKKYIKYTFVPFIDDSPIPEVKTAHMAGLGVIGKNGLLINKKYGSWIFIGEIVTDAIIVNNENIKTNNTCINCKKCINNCPSSAIGNDFFNKKICVSYITQKKGELNPLEIDILRKGKSIWGCDICQEDCPMNINIPNTPITDFHVNTLSYITTANYDDLNDRAYLWRGKNIIYRNIHLLQNEKIKYN